MNFRFKVSLWFALSLMVLASVLVFTAHWHLDEELRQDRWDRSHPKFPQWVIHGSYTDEEVQDILGELLHIWLGVGIPLCLLSLGIGYVIASRSVRPVRQINRELAKLEAGSLDQGVTLPDHDPELVLLVRHINDLLRRVGNSYNEMAEHSARVAHELRTPLTLLRMRVEAAAPDLPPEFSEEVQEEIRRLSQLVERALLAAKAEGGRLEVSLQPVDISALVDELREAYAPLAHEAGLNLTVKTPPGQMVTTDPAILRQILHNLFGNAVRYGAGDLRLRLRPQEATGTVLLILTNKVAARSSTEGTGLGLRLVRSLSFAMPGTTFHTKRLGQVFSARLRWLAPDSQRQIVSSNPRAHSSIR